MINTFGLIPVRDKTFRNKSFILTKRVSELFQFMSTFGIITLGAFPDFDNFLGINPFAEKTDSDLFLYGTSIMLFELYFDFTMFFAADQQHRKIDFMSSKSEFYN